MLPCCGLTNNTLFHLYAPAHMGHIHMYGDHRAAWELKLAADFVLSVLTCWTTLLTHTLQHWGLQSKSRYQLLQLYSQLGEMRLILSAHVFGRRSRAQKAPPSSSVTYTRLRMFTRAWAWCCCFHLHTCTWVVNFQANHTALSIPSLICCPSLLSGV